MSETELRSVVVERQLSHPPEKVWRALTVPHLMAEWLLQSDFQPVVGHHFRFTQSWGEIACKVLAVDPPRSLSYTWSALGLDSTVTFTLTPAGGGTHLRMEQAGFRPDQDRAFKGARGGWTGFLGALENLLGRID